jgi:FkbM family methyltransferase
MYNQSLPFFLYKRLSRWITCEFQLTPDSKIRLQNKFEIASFKDVFCHPFYWQLFEHVTEPPKFVVDCGAHCGHFTVLADICFHSKFGNQETSYLLIEPNPYLLPVIKKNITDTGLASRVKIEQGLLGCKENDGELWIHPKNYLVSSLYKTNGATAQPIKSLDLTDLAGGKLIDLMKIDIEGGEFEFVHQSLGILSQTKLVFMELHTAPEEKHKQLYRDLASVGLYLATKPIMAHGQQLLIFDRKSKHKDIKPF